MTHEDEACATGTGGTAPAYSLPIRVAGHGVRLGWLLAIDAKEMVMSLLDGLASWCGGLDYWSGRGSDSDAGAWKGSLFT